MSFNGYGGVEGEMYANDGVVVAKRTSFPTESGVLSDFNLFTSKLAAPWHVNKQN